jgi:hypothetical protein
MCQRLLLALSLAHLKCQSISTRLQGANHRRPSLSCCCENPKCHHAYATYKNEFMSTGLTSITALIFIGRKFLTDSFRKNKSSGCKIKYSFVSWPGGAPTWTVVLPLPTELFRLFCSSSSLLRIDGSTMYVTSYVLPTFNIEFPNSMLVRAVDRRL